MISKSCSSSAAPCRRVGFTLVEILVVVAIIAILAGIVLKISGFASGKSDRAKAISDMERIKNALEEYRINNGCYFTNSVGTNSADVVAFSNALGRLISGGVRVTDPWGRNYRYQPNYSQGYRLWSTGPNSNTANPEDDVESETGSF